MIPILYADTPLKGTGTLGLGRLNDCISGTCRRVLNGIDEIEITYPNTGRRAEDIKTSRVILAQPEYQTDPQPYRIYDVLNQTSGMMQICARHVKEEASYIPVMPFSVAGATPEDVFTAMTSNLAEGQNKFSFESDITNTNDFRINVPASMANVFAGMDGSILDVFGGEYEFDFYDVKLWQRRGHVRGVTLRYGKQITNLKREESIDRTITAILPFWADSEGNLVTLSEKVISSSKKADYPFYRTVVKDCSDAFDTQPTEAQLRAYATAYMGQTGIDDPQVQMDINFEHLGHYQEYRDLGVFETVNLGDTVNIIYEHLLNVNATARIIETQYDFLNEHYRKVSIGKVKYNLIDVLNGK